MAAQRQLVDIPLPADKFTDLHVMIAHQAAGDFVLQRDLFFDILIGITTTDVRQQILSIF